MNHKFQYFINIALIVYFFISCNENSNSVKVDFENENVTDINQNEIIKKSIFRHGSISIQLFENAITILEKDEFLIPEYEKLFSESGREIENLCAEIENLSGFNEEDLQKFLNDNREHIERLEELRNKLNELQKSRSDAERIKVVLAEEDYKNASLRFGDILNGILSRSKQENDEN